MDRLSPVEVRQRLRVLGVDPSRALGQNFLIDANTRDRILGLIDLAPNESVLEIGPGLGALTDGLAERASHVTAIEFDRRLAEGLQQQFAGRPNVSIVCADALRDDLAARVTDGARVVVGNFPYSVGTRILMDLVCLADPPDRLVVTLQREVADRVVARPATADYGLTAVWAQVGYTPRLARTVSRRCFWPVPRVESGTIVLDRRSDLPDAALRTHVYAVTKRLFAHRRKQLIRLIADGPWGCSREVAAEWLVELGASVQARAEELDVDAWLELTRRLVGFREGS